LRSSTLIQLIHSKVFSILEIASPYWLTSDNL
jgi:hypothetical protein